MVIFGELNAFSPPEVEYVLSKVNASLCSGGQFIAEVHTFDAIERYGREENSWQSAKSGLFSDRPHICLTLNRWHEAERAAEAEYFVIDAVSSEVDYYRNTLKAYSVAEYVTLVSDAGFVNAAVLPAWGKSSVEDSDQFMLLLATKT
jgi:hypothetical protein